MFAGKKIDEEALLMRAKKILNNNPQKTNKTMKKTKQILMGLVLFALATVASVGIFGLPKEDVSFGEYVALLFGSKAVGVLALMAIIVVVRWNDKHRWLDI